MGRFIGGKFGDCTPVNPTGSAPSAVYSSPDQYYMKKEGGWIGPKGISATGGSVPAGQTYTDPGGQQWKYHIFSGPGSMVVSALASDPTWNYFEYVVVGGGGGGAVGGGGGGGGGGGVRTNFSGDPTISPRIQPATDFPVTTSTYPVQVGDGGTGASPMTDTYGTPGGPSILANPGPTNDITANGGGRGKSTPTAGGSSDGGCGGGGYGSSSQQPAGSGNTPPYSPVQGYPGGQGGGGSYHGGGGGGANQAGQNGSGSGAGGGGGTGLQVLIAGPTAGPTLGDNGYFGGGGGGGGQPPQNGAGSGGTGGGGNGAAGPPSKNGSPGSSSTGGGGGGGANPGSGAGGAGGPGYCAVRYKITGNE